MDFKEAIDLSNHIDELRFIPALHRWVSVEIGESPIYRKPGGLFIGCIVWGKYVDTLIDIIIPTLLTPGNFPSLESATLLLRTDEASLDKLIEAIKPIEAIGVNVEIHLIPEEVMSLIDEFYNNKYWLLGAAHNLDIQHARRIGCNYHMLMPDHVYSENYFTNLMRLSKDHPAIVQLSISSEMEAVSAALNELKSDGVIAISAKELIGVGIDCIHKNMGIYFRNDKDLLSDLPSHQYLLWNSMNQLHVFSPHTNPMYLSHEILNNAPMRLFNTIDGQLPYFIPSKYPLYVPKPEDDMAFIEISSDNKPSSCKSVDIIQFCLSFWVMVYLEQKYERYFDLDNAYALPERYVGKVDLDDEMPAKAASALRESISKAYPIFYETFPKELHKKDAAL